MASRFFRTGTYLGRRIVDLARECSGWYWPVVTKGIRGRLIQPSMAYHSCARWDCHWLLIMRWNLVSTFSLSCKEVEKGVAWLSLVHCEMLDYACTAHFFIMEIDSSKKKKKKKKALCLVGFYLLPWTRNRLLSLYGLTYKVSEQDRHCRTCT